MLHIAILNLMPNKRETEEHLLSLLEHSNIPFVVTFLYAETHNTKSAEFEYIKENYSTFSKIKNQQFDGLIVTGAPVELIEFENVDYWNELKEIFDWTKTNVKSSFFICWASQAALYHFYGIPKYKLSQKMFGIFEHSIPNPDFPLMKNFKDKILIPQSRHTEIRFQDVEKISELQILAISEKAGISIVSDKFGKQIFASGHSEYPQLRLKFEYERDLAKGLEINIPRNYFPQNEPSRLPEFSWRKDAELLFLNWLEML